MNNIQFKKIAKSTAIATFAVSVLLVMSACGGGDSKSSDKGTKSDAVKADVSLTDSATGAMGIDLGDLKVSSGDEVVLNVTNDGTQVHNLHVEGGDHTADLQPYSAAELDLGKVTKSLTVFCSIPGHREAGMEEKINIES